MLSKKHYEVIAGILRDARAAMDPDTCASSDVVDYIEKELIKTFRQDNPNFDPARFRAASGSPAAPYVDRMRED
jgi:hypothetical protein